MTERPSESDLIRNFERHCGGMYATEKGDAARAALLARFAELRGVRADVIEECAKFVEQHQETISETAHGSTRHLTPRKAGNQMGIAYVDGLRALRASAAPEEGMLIASAPETLRQLGSRLADLLDADHWNNIEPLLIELAAALSPDSRKAEPVAWRWRFTEPGPKDVYPWHYQDFDPEPSANLARQIEVEPLYAALPPATEDGGREEPSPIRALKQICADVFAEMQGHAPSEQYEDGYSDACAACGEATQQYHDGYRKTVRAQVRALSPSPSVGTPAQTSANREAPHGN